MTPPEIIDRGVRLGDRLTRLEWLPILLARASVGTMFALSGSGKLHELDEFSEYFRSLGIPAAGVQAPFVAALECVGGLALVAGFGVRVFGALLAATMAVALAAVQLRKPENLDPANLFYLPEWLLLVILLWLAFAGAGRVGVDGWLRRRLGAVAGGPPSSAGP